MLTVHNKRKAPEMGEEPTNNSQRPYVIAAVSLGVVVLIALAFALFGMGKKPSINNTNTNTSQLTGITTSTSRVSPEPAEVHTRSGTVTKIDTKSITFVTPAYNDKIGDFEMKEFEAQTDASTVYKRIDPERPATPVSPGSAQLVPVTTPISRSDVAKGDRVDVTSKENMRIATSVLATEVVKLP